MDCTTKVEVLGARAGTATRRSGRDTAAKIVKAAYDLLMSGGYADFSMRNTADRAGVRLANLQYYFPKKEDLIQALMNYVGAIYDGNYARCLSEAGDSPQEQFEAAVRFNLDDINNLDTRHFFIQYWPLLGMLDNYDGKVLAEAYSSQLQQMEELITALHPEATGDEVEHRAGLLSAMFEGMMIVGPSPDDDPEKLQAFKQLAVKIAYGIAAG